MPESPGIADEVTTLPDGSGLSGIAVETKVEPARFPSSRHIVEVELCGWLPLLDIFPGQAEINDVLVKSDRTLSRFAATHGEAVNPTSAHVITAVGREVSDNPLQRK